MEFPSARLVPPAIWLVLVSPRLGHAEERARLGDTSWGLPGIVRVGVPASGPRRFAAAGSAGYGFTEGQGSADGAHHRLAGSVAAAVAPLPILELSLRFDGRYDMHPDDGHGAHGSGVGDPRLLARAGGAVGGNFLVGGELSAWFPGKDAPSLAFNATTLDAHLLGAWVPRAGPTVAATAGFRLDNSKNAAPDLSRLRPGDRLSLGLSASNAVLLGAGASIPVAERTDLLGEVSADLLVGSAAPSAGKSPIRIAVGARQGLSDSFALELAAEVSPSGRPSLGPGDPLVPIEPRFSLVAGLRYRLPFDAKPAAPAEPAPAPRSEPAAQTTAEKSGAVVVRVLDAKGAPVAQATVDVRAGDKTARLPKGDDGGFRAADLPAGSAHLTISADGFTTVERDVTIAPGKAEAVSVELAQAPPSGQLRGLVRSFNGRGLSASIRVEPLGLEGKTDADGNFTIDVPPGSYEIVIRAERYKPQRRKVKVDENGVTVLNADLFEGHR